MIVLDANEEQGWLVLKLFLEGGRGAQGPADLNQEEGMVSR